MPPTREFIQAMLSQLDKRDSSENQEHDNEDIPPGERWGIIIAGLTLLVAVVSLLRCSRLRGWDRWVSTLSTSPLARVCPPLLVLHTRIHIYTFSLSILYRMLSAPVSQMLRRQPPLPQ